VSRPELAISRFSQARHEQRALREGNYQQIHVASEQLAFLCQIEDEYVLVVVNSATSPIELDLPIAVPDGGILLDLLEEHGRVEARNQRVRVRVPACWVCLLKGRY
jgi:hypothetical protein